MFASLVWEYLGELRERASINDIVVTPLAGVVLGEMTLQLGAFFDRSCDTAHNRVLGSVLGPMKSLHDALDGAVLKRDDRCDALGFTQHGAHSLQFTAGVGALVIVDSPSAPVSFASQLGMHTRIVAVNSYGSEGEGMTTFADGNVTEFWLSTLLSTRSWVDFSLRATLLPIGLHYRKLQLGRGGLRGYELLFGLLLDTEYTVHRFAWSQPEARQSDRFFELDVPGVGFVYRRALGRVALEAELQATVAMLGIDALARPQYLLSHPGGEELASVAHNEGYNYVIGLRVSPRVRLTWDGLELAAELAAVRGMVITENDRYAQPKHYADGSEQRMFGNLWLSWGPARWPLRAYVLGSLLQRVSRIDTTEATRTELRALMGLGAQL
jgi:hypothetical protein